MNKKELSDHLKLSEQKVNDILTAALLSLDLPDYDAEQVKAIEEIVKLVEDKQAKTYKEAGGLYRKPQNEAQLQEIAARYSQTDRILEIVTVLKLKPGNITDEQFEQFREVCEQVQQGIELPIVAQGVLNKAKAAKTKPAPEFAPQTEPEQKPEQSSAITPTSERKVAKSNGNGSSKLDRSVFGADADLNAFAAKEAALIQGKLPEVAAEAIFDAGDRLIEQSYAYGTDLFDEHLANVMATAAHSGATKQVLDEVKRRRRPHWS